MKKIFLFATLCILMASCSKDSLKLENPNEPLFKTLQTEEGIEKAALGVYHPMRDMYFAWFTLTNHNIMGDMTTSPVGNFGWRWTNQVSSITRPNGEVLLPSQGGTQPQQLAVLNSRDFGDDCPFTHEWIPMYGTIGHCNLMLANIDNVEFTGTEAEIEIKKKTFKAWFLWWKGFSYSRLGSIYEKALISDTYEKLVTTYSSNTEIIAEANKILKEAAKQLDGIDESDPTYKGLISFFIPQTFHAGNGGVITPEMFKRNINTYIARNLLVNKYAKDLNESDLTEIEKFATDGIKQGDKIFNIRNSANSNVCFVWTTAWSPQRILLGWEFISERLVQDFKEGDKRYERNIITLPSEEVFFNPRGRGFSYGTRFWLNDIADGGDYASLTAGLAEIPFACSYEENELMLAEVKIRKNDIAGGLKHIDNVREHQKAGLPAADSSLSKEDALEELRSERRVGLFFKGTAFYDARRWGILKPVSEGGGRTNANVVVSPAGEVEACTIDYNYLEWWSPPALETDFNPIVPGTMN